MTLMFTYTLRQIKGGTGFSRDAEFIPVDDEIRADYESKGGAEK